jgi:hypothetical protein
MHTRSAARAHGHGTFAYAGSARGIGGGGAGGGHRRRSDLRLKHDIVAVAQLANGLRLYRFVYNGGHTTYVGVIAQEAQHVVPTAVTRGSDGYLRVRYDKLDFRFQTYREWLQGDGRTFLSVPAGQ